jgi:hypothetical protein
LTHENFGYMIIISNKVDLITNHGFEVNHIIYLLLKSIFLINKSI